MVFSKKSAAGFYLRRKRFKKWGYFPAAGAIRGGEAQKKPRTPTYKMPKLPSVS
jgi:hypothetical protein